MEIKRKDDPYKILLDMLTTLICVAAATGIGWLFRSLKFPETNIVVVYILSVVLTSRLTKGFVYGIVSSVMATFAFNYFFTEPLFTLSVKDPTYIITFIIMTFTAVITSTLTSKVMQKAFEAREKEEEASALYRLTNHLTDAVDIENIACITIKTLSEILNCRAACLCYNESGQPEKSFMQQKDGNDQIRRKVEDIASLKQRIESLRTAYDAGNEFYDWPIYGRDTTLGIIRIPKENVIQMNDAQIRLLHSMIESTALAMDRFRSTQEHIRSAEEVTQERYRSNLLRAISHDLRTPLSGIMGTSEMLMSMTDKGDARYSLAEGIYKDADWLHSLVENILSLTRLQDGKLTINKQIEAVEEVVGVAVNAIAKRTPNREITVNVPDNVMLVPMDARLIDQVLVNLLDNAVKHTPENKEINLTVSENSLHKMAVFTVSDCGSGISESDLPHIFQMFYTTRVKEADSRCGIGLGLAICDSIVKAHGGTITAKNRSVGNGAEFTFTLPLEVKSNG